MRILTAFIALAVCSVASAQTYTVKVDANGNVLHSQLVNADTNPDGEVNFATGKLLVNGVVISGGSGSGSVTSVGVSGANGIGVTGSPITTSGTIALSLGNITPTSVAATGTVTGSNLSGTNTGDQDLSGLAPKSATYITETANGTLTNEFALGSLATGILKNTTTTGVPSIAAAGVDYVAPNAAITGATNTKITYDTKGLVTAGTAATTADINDSSNRRYVTDAQLVVIGNTSGTNTGDQIVPVNTTGTASQFFSAYNSATGAFTKTQPTFADLSSHPTTLSGYGITDGVSTSRSISTTSPLTGGGDLSADRTLAIADAAADGSTKGAAAFTAADFNATSGLISIDYANGQSASSSLKGFLTSSDWTTFNNKVATTRTISTTSPLTGGGDLSANRTIAINDAAADGTTKGAATFTAADFNASSGLISIDYANGQKSGVASDGFLTQTDWITFNSKLTSVANDPLIAAMGDLIVGTSASNAINFPLGSQDGLVLAIDSTNATTGINWKKFMSVSNLSPAIIESQTQDASIASAGTLVLTGVGNDGDLIQVTGTTSITTITIPVGQSRILRFADELVLGSSISGNIIAANGSITTATGTYCVVTGDGTNVYVDHFNRIGPVVANIEGGSISFLDYLSFRNSNAPDKQIRITVNSDDVSPADQTLAILLGGDTQLRLLNSSELIVNAGIVAFAGSGFTALDNSTRVFTFGTADATFPSGTYGVVPDSRTISTTSPLSGGGNLTTNRTIAIADAAADGSTKGAAAFTAADFNATSGLVSLDYANAQAASSSLKGFLTSTDWTTFNNKVATSRTISTTSPLSGGGDLSADRTLSLSTVPVNTGGTGATTLTAHGVLIGNGTSAVAVTGTGTAGQALLSNGSSADPTFQGVVPITCKNSSTLTVLTSGTPADLGTITIPAGITRWRIGGTSGASTFGNGFLAETASGTLASATFEVYDASGGGGNKVINSSAGPTGTPSGISGFIAVGTNGTGYVGTGSTLYVRQTANSANAGTISYYVVIVPLP